MSSTSANAVQQVQYVLVQWRHNLLPTILCARGQKGIWHDCCLMTTIAATNHMASASKVFVLYLSNDEECRREYVLTEMMAS